MTQSKHNRLNFNKLCSQLNKHTLKQLIKQNNSKSQIALNSLHFDRNINPNQINVVSPFYNRSRCPSKGPCFCPYHRMKNLKTNNRISFASRNLRNENMRKKYRKITTQQNQAKQDKLNINQRQHKVESNRNTQKFDNQKQKYTNVSHKVNCQNQQFQQFLKKNQLYILTGKLPTNLKNKQKQNQDSETLLLQNFISNFNFGQFHKQNQKLLKLNTNQSKKRRYGNISKGNQNLLSNFNKQDREILIRKIRDIVLQVLNGKKRLSLNSLRKLQIIFNNLIQQKKQIVGQTQQYLKDRESLETFRMFIKDFNGNQRILTILSKKQSQKRLKYHKSHRTSMCSRQSLLQNNNFDNINDQLKQGFKDNKISQVQNQDQKQLNKENRDSKDSRDSRDSRINTQNIQNKNINKFKPKLQTQNTYIKQQQQTKFKNKRKDRNKFSQSFNRNRRTKQQDILKINKKLTKKNNKSSLNSSIHLDQSANKGQAQNKGIQNQSIFANKSGYFGNGQQYSVSRFHDKKDKQTKFMQVMNNINQQQVVIDQNYIKMKKYIQRNKMFLKKMQMKLLRFDLGVFVIEPTDSLITRKKKIRCLKQLVEKNQKQENKGFYDQIMKYLQIYTEHCNMLMKKQGSRNQGQYADFDYQNEEQLQILDSKDYTNSLKFIALQENPLNNRQTKLQGWISIPQYITKDKTRYKTLANFETFIKSVKKIQSIQNKRINDKQQQQNQDILVQKQVRNKCTVNSYHYYWAISDKKQLQQKLNQNQQNLTEKQIKNTNLIQKIAHKIRVKCKN